MTVLRDATGASRAAQYLCWHPDQSRRLAVAHATMVLLVTEHAELAKLMCLIAIEGSCSEGARMLAPRRLTHGPSKRGGHGM